MQPLVRAALAVGALALISGIAAQQAAERAASRAPRVSSGTGVEEVGALARMPCGPRELPEGDACVPLPDRLPPTGSASWVDPDPPGEETPEGSRIPRRPDRPVAVRALRLPIEGDPLLLDLTGAPIRAADPDLSVLRLGAPRGTPVLATPLERQDGSFEVLAVETLGARGLVVVALAKTQEGKRDARWLVVWAALDGAGPNVARGSKLAGGEVVGFSGSPPAGSGTVGEHLRFEVRRLRAGVDVAATPVASLLGDVESIAIDARNVLPMR